MNTTPSDTQIADGLERVAVGLKKAIPLASTNEVNMKYAYVEGLLEPCGLPACHGGWIAFAAYRGCIPQYKPEKEPLDGFYKGVLILNNLCGFHRPTSKAIDGLSSWANKNPIIWGNPYGETMFYEDDAFLDVDATNPLTIQDIIAHYRGVVKRLRATEESEVRA